MSRSEAGIAPISTASASTAPTASIAARSKSREYAVEEAQTQRLVTERQLRAAARRYPGRRGPKRIAGILDAAREPGITRSMAERRFRELLRAAQLPEARTNFPLHGYNLDFYWPELGVVVEVQGYKFHSGRAAFERDTRKGAKLAAAGLTVCYVTWRQMKEEPYAVVARIAQVLARAEARRAA